MIYDILLYDNAVRYQSITILVYLFVIKCVSYKLLIIFYITHSSI